LGTAATGSASGAGAATGASCCGASMLKLGVVWLPSSFIEKQKKKRQVCRSARRRAPPLFCLSERRARRRPRKR
jgi:hypothetical protein